MYVKIGHLFIIKFSKRNVSLLQIHSNFTLESLESVCALTCVDVYIYTTNISYRYLRQTQGEREGEREHIL